jgi:hypothetical protein
MQILGVPHTQNDMVVKITMKGISRLKDGKYKKRHYGAKDVMQMGNGKFIPLTNYKSMFPKEFEKKKPKKASQQTTDEPKSQKVKQGFGIDRFKITPRLQTFYLTKRGTKQLYFWTITFPQGTTEQTAHQLFNIWLTRCRDELNLKSYLWVKEKQKNNTVHFHIAIHQRMDIKRANRYMRASIMRQIDEGKINWSRSAATRYNGVDIAKDRKTKRVVNFAKGNKQIALRNYLTKYVTKNNTKFQMLAWHCSRDYSNTVTGYALTRSELIEGKLFSNVRQYNIYENDWIVFYSWQESTPKTVMKYLTNVNNQVQKLLFN